MNYIKKKKRTTKLVSNPLLFYGPPPVHAYRSNTSTDPKTDSEPPRSDPVRPSEPSPSYGASPKLSGGYWNVTPSNKSG